MLNQKTNHFICATILAVVVASCDTGNDKNIDDETGFVQPNVQHCTVKAEGEVYLAEVMPVQILGQRLQPSIALAVDHINKGGGINGRQLGLITCDTEADEEIGRTVMTELSEIAPLGGIVGPAFSSIVLATYDIAAAANKMMISATATSPALTGMDDNGFFNRVEMSDAVSNVAMAGLLNSRKHQKLFLFLQNDAWGEGIGALLTAAFLGETSVYYYDEENLSFADEAVAQAQQFSPDAIFVAGVPKPEIAFIKTAKQASISAAWYWSNRHPEVFESESEYLDGSIMLSQPSREEDPSYQRFIEAFKAAYGEDTSNIAMGCYDATFLLGIAMSLATSPTDGIQVRDALQNSISTGEIVRPNEWEKVLQNISAGQMNYEGAANSINFDENGDVTGSFQEWIYQHQTANFALGGCWSGEGTQIPCS